MGRFSCPFPSLVLCQPWYGMLMLRPSPNHGTQWLPNDDDDDDVVWVVSVVDFRVVVLRQPS